MMPNDVRKPPSSPPQQPVASASPPNPVPAPAPVLSSPPPPPPKKRRSEKSREGWRSALSTIAILIIAPLIAFTLTAFVFQSYEVDGPSMETTLQNHDRLIVVKVPRTIARITHHAYIPQRGDIVIFSKTEDFDFNGTQERQLIKRVIGLPGERVVVKDGTLTVYNKEHPEGFQPDRTMAYGKVITTTTGNVDVTVPADQIFVCGDNRTNSLDSRSFGPIPAKAIVGKLVLRIFPFSNAESF
jgi:signal peptidase I